jgi:hypothetical protein
MVNVRDLIDDISIGNSQAPNNSKRLSKQKESLQNAWEMRCEKLSGLELNLAIETDLAIKFMLEKQIQSEILELGKLNDRIKEINELLQ